MTKIIDTYFKEWWKLWTSRNEDRHGSNRASQAQASKAQALRDLQIFYNTYKDKPVSAEDQWILDIPIESAMTWRTDDIIRWINTKGPVLKESYTTSLETG